MVSSRKKPFIAIHDGRPFFDYTRVVRNFDEDKQVSVKLYPPFVYDKAQWQEHWEDIVGYDDPDHPYRLKDLIHFNRPEDIHPDFMQETTRQLTPIINRRVGIELQKLEVRLSLAQVVRTVWATMYIRVWILSLMETVIAFGSSGNP